MNAWLAGMNQLAAAGLAALLNTLWYAAAVVALTWVVLRFLRRINAATRYWIWTAVLGFLVLLPFLPALVAHVEAGESVAPAAAAPLATVPAAPPAVQHLAPVTLTLSSAPGSNPWPLLLMAVWIAVAGWQLVRLLRGVVLVRRLKTCADVAPVCPLPLGLRRPVRVLTSYGLTSPVAVGYLHPAVIFPPDLVTRLEEGEKRDALLHELAHLARYDDWVALGTYALRALLALHPVAPFVLSRIEREREIACDDFVVAHTGSARNYARSLARLHDLRSAEGTRLLAPALLGRRVSLAHRLESLLRRGRAFSARPSLAKLGVSAFLLILLLGAGGLVPGWIAIAHTKVASPAETRLAKTAKFEVASIKPYQRPPRGSVRVGMFVRPRNGRLYATGVTVRGLIRAAYGVEDAQIVGGPKWINSEQFDIQAEADSATDAELRKMSVPQAILVKRRMVRALLADRFGLKLHHEARDLPVYALMVAKHGPKVYEVSKPTSPILGGVGGPHGPKGSPAWYQHDPRRAAMFASYTIMSEMARNLSRFLGRPVLDKTGLTGHYSFALYWSMGLDERFAMGGPSFGSGVQTSGAAPSPGPSGPSIFTALRDQLGLKLKSEKGTVDVLVIDHISPPTPN